MKSSKLKKRPATESFVCPKKSCAMSGVNLFQVFCLALIFMLILAGCGTFRDIAMKKTKDNAIDAEGKAGDVQNETSSQDNQSDEDAATEKEGTSEQIESTEESSREELTGETDVIDPSEETINVYYANSSAEYLAGEARTVEGSGKLVDAIYEMMKNPIDSSLIVLIPATTKINSIRVFDGVAKIDFSEDFISDRFVSDTVDILLVYSIVNTLTEFSGVESVEFYIDGTKIDTLGQLDIKEPVFRRSDLIKQ
jgi:germination protein M